MIDILISELPHTWLIDVDGTLVRHNGQKNGGDQLLPGVKEFWGKIPPGDMIILLSARKEEEKLATLDFLNHHGLRYDRVLFGLPTGERVLLNDCKQSGLQTAISVNIPRDVGLTHLNISIDFDL